MPESEKPDDYLRQIGEVFIETYNKTISSSFGYLDNSKNVDINEHGCDLCFINDGSGEKLHVQLVEAIPCRNSPRRESSQALTSLMVFANNGSENCDPIHLQEPALRAEEAVGHKINAQYASPENLILLLDFGYFHWGDQSAVEKMRAKITSMNPPFKHIYCIHLGKRNCLQLF